MSDSRDKLSSVSLLKRYFTYVTTLGHYVASLQSVSSVELTPTLDGVAGSTYQGFLEGTYVASEFSLHQDAPPVSPVQGEDISMYDVIPSCQKIILGSKVPNVLTLGYKMSEHGVSNFAVNTIVTALHAQHWNVLVHVIGRPTMIHLLTKAYVFTILPNGCLCQMTGKPIYSLPKPETREDLPELNRMTRKRKCLPNDHHDKPVKRLKIYPGRRPTDRTKTEAYTERSPAGVSLIRQRMFYARPVYSQHSSRSNQITIGLPPNHILNRLDSPFPQNDLPVTTVQDPNPQIQQSNARRLAKYIFPRQYGLPNAFHFFKFSEREAYQVPDFVNRDQDIEKLASDRNHRIRTPKRLRQVLPMLDKLAWRHRKCKYKLLLDGSCPSKIKKSILNSEVILEMMSENRVLSQISARVANSSIDTAGNSIIPMGQTQAEHEVRRKPHFVEFCCPHGEVYKYVVRVVHCVIPKSFWGSKSNFKVICRHLKTFIAARRYEKVSLHHVLQDFSTSACEWLMPPGDGRNQGRVPVTDALKRRELLEEFLFWFFDSFIISIIRTTFYVTESAVFRNRILYFRQDDWNVLCAPLLQDLKTEKFEKIPDEEAHAILQQRKLGFSFVRLLPKELGVRPIVNLRRKQKTETSDPRFPESSINKILQGALQILTYEKANQPEALGAACFSVDDHYAKFKEFKMRLNRNPDGTLPKLYFAKVDVQACFDTIQQTKLLEILKEILSEDSYTIQRYTQVSSVMGKTRTMFRKRAWADGDAPHFLKYAKELANVLRHTIFVDQVTCTIESREQVLQLLEQHITENIVKIGDGYYRQIIGIPQGSTLSTILCSFFYGDMEKHFGTFSEDPHSVLLRNVDDYLFISTNLAKARSFVDMMNKGHPEYGCFISKAKTFTNFDYNEDIMNVTGPWDRAFPWCGYLIDMKDLSISDNHTRYYDGHLRDSLTVDRGCKSGSEFRRKMLILAKARSHIIYTDSELNSEHSVFLNIYRNFLIAAMKMHCYLRHWNVNTKKNKSFLYETVKQMHTYCFASIRGKTLSKMAREYRASIKLQKEDVSWLGIHAFHTVLSRKPTEYKALLRALAFDLSLPKSRRQAQRFGLLVKEGFASVQNISE
ncbi:telomerase reverse transcriptase [Moniliophthora roreri MCA 2997]|uniref:Telomerase reverse transcriptase n=1 Tax=Moniliophthora roreri (strain MCA 2997) TaxID=1381753 RepID=V2Y6F7_MONRO|nr:telomerase reverse transcriptase [Moniliophthora roreri MCA 2997]